MEMDEELSALDVIQLKITEEEKAYKTALIQNKSGWELNKIKERLEELKSCRKYVEEYLNGPSSR